MRQLTGVWGWVTRCVLIIFALFQLYTAGFGSLPNLQQNAIHVGFAVVGVLALYPIASRSKSERKIPVLDIALIALVIISSVNACIKSTWFLTHVGVTSTIDVFLGFTIILITIEAARRTIGWSLPIFAILMILYSLFGDFIPGKFGHAGIGFISLIEELYQTTNGIWSTLTGMSATLLASFLIFGELLYITGSVETFINVAMKLVGKVRGGPALAGVIGDFLFGIVSGSAVANAAAVGSYSIPLMKKMGYKAEYASAVEAVSSTGSQISPPIMGAGAFIMAELLGVSYLTIVIAAIIPTLLYYQSLFLHVRLKAVGMNVSMVSDQQELPWSKILAWRKVITLSFPVVVLLVLIGKGYTIWFACFFASMTLTILYIFIDFSFSKLKERFTTLIAALDAGAKAIIGIAPMIVCASIVICLLNLTGFGVKLAELLTGIIATSIPLGLILAAVTAIVLGTALPTTGAYVLSAAILATPLIAAGILPLPAHMFLFYFACLSQLTPPVAAAVFVTAGIAECPWMPATWIAMKLALAIYVIPFIFAVDPNLLMMGTPFAIILDSLCAFAGVALTVVALEGFINTNNKLALLSRIFFGIGGILLLMPGTNIRVAGIVVSLVALISIFALGGKSKFAMKPHRDTQENY